MMTPEDIRQSKIEIGQKVKQKMINLGLNNQSLAKLCGLTPNQVGWIVKGERDMTLSSYFRLLFIINLTLNIEEL
jgi:transcriptional regulator with XRE-family HTH domain